MLDAHEIEMLHYPVAFGASQDGQNFRVYGPDWAGRAEETLEAMYDGETPMVAIEVFDHPLARQNGQMGVFDEGAWFIGHEVDVLAALEQEGLQDWLEQYDRRPPEDFYYDEMMA